MTTKGRMSCIALIIVLIAGACVVYQFRSLIPGKIIAIEKNADAYRFTILVEVLGREFTYTTEEGGGLAKLKGAEYKKVGDRWNPWR